jgi:hypothetical protein
MATYKGKDGKAYCDGQEVIGWRFTTVPWYMRIWNWFRELGIRRNK